TCSPSPVCVALCSVGGSRQRIDGQPDRRDEAEGKAPVVAVHRGSGSSRSRIPSPIHRPARAVKDRPRRRHPMTRLARRAPLLVALCLLTSAATASAECAWVLWEGRPKKPVLPLADVDLFSFKRVSAFTTFEACSASAKIQAEGTAGVWTGTSEGKSKWMA